MSVHAGAMSTQPYISRSMSRRRFRRKERKAAAETNAVVYRDRSSWALDAQLASLASAGDDAAFTTLVTRFQPAVFRWALIFARDPDEAEDITQEVFVRTHRQIGDYRSDGPLEGWLYRITRRAATLIRELFAALPQRQREIFDLVDLQGLSPAEVAERTGMKPVSVRANLFKARKAIRDNLLVTHPAYGELSR